jgi:hypothetical protein
MTDLPTSTGLCTDNLCEWELTRYEYLPETPEHEITPDAAWESLKKLLKMFEVVLELLSLVLVLSEVSRMTGGYVLVVVVLLHQIVARYLRPRLWTLCEQDPAFLQHFWLMNPHLACFAYISNDGYKRAQALNKFTDGSFRLDIISNNLGNWIMDGTLSICLTYDGC